VGQFVFDKMDAPLRPKSKNVQWYICPFIILRGIWYDIVLNVHAPTEVKIDDMKDRVYEELEHVFEKFLK
jgi:hypothetical protein